MTAQDNLNPVQFYHGTSSKHVEGIRANGLTSSSYDKYNNTLTTRKDEAGYFGGKHGAVVTVGIPKEQLDEYTHPGDNLRALKKPLPSHMISNIEEW